MAEFERKITLIEKPGRKTRFVFFPHKSDAEVFLEKAK